MVSTTTPTRRLDDAAALDALAALLDRAEWSSDTCEPVITLIQATGRVIRDVDDTEDDATTEHSETPVWIYVGRERHPDAWVGPYANQDAAALALDSLLLDSICEEDATDCWTTTDDPAPDAEVIHIDPTDPHHTRPNIDTQED